jgi:DNA polymerase II large subunit
MNINEYFKALKKNVDEIYEIANSARGRGLDPVEKVEIPLASNLAEKCIGLISTIYPQLEGSGVAARILELEKMYGPLDTAVSFKIAEEVAKERFCKFESLLQAIDAGIRVGFAYNTLGVVSSPIEGFTELKLKKTRDGKEYFAAYFSGPIRSAGTTAECMALLLIDYLRETFGFAKYDPDELEVKRYVTENYDYHERVNNLQYLPTEEEIAFLAKNLPIEITGEPSEQREVSNYKDLPRIETNQIRGGMCLVFSEGLAQKAQKGMRLLKGVQAKGFVSTSWNFLDEYVALHKKREKGSSDTSPTYIKDLVAGRPVYGHPSRSGGFRFRYGKSRVNGFSATSVHPATMAISNGFLSTGTQLKIEKPTKGCAITACEKMDGPIVKLNDGSVRKIETIEEAKKIYKDSVEIIYLGDILFSLGDVVNRNYELLKPGYVEEWWELELKKSAEKSGEQINVDAFNVKADEAIKISEKYGIPLHPRWIYYWKEIDYPHFLALIDWLGHGKLNDGVLILPYTLPEREKFSKGKRALELIGCEHRIFVENAILSENESKALLFNLGINNRCNNFQAEIDRLIQKTIGKNEKNTLEIVNELCTARIKDKSGTWIGTRMGRPEKAKLRKLTGSPHVLFPVGEEGGRLRSVQAAVEVGNIFGDFPIYYCEQCKSETIYPRCENCNDLCKKMNYCPECNYNYPGKCPEHLLGVGFKERRIDSKHYFEAAKRKICLSNGEMPAIVKGVRGTSSKDHNCENLAKGLLRAKHHLNVNKDGTIRYDGTELPITHFKPVEIGVSVQKLKELGYEKDINGKELENEGQVIEILPHDIILPACPDSPDEKADDVFVNIAHFLDDMLVKFYGMSTFYNVKKRDDLIGQLIVCMAPHNCAGVIARIVGFSKVQGILASPYMHAAVRRDCDGDEVAVMMLLDVLLNFSRKFLPSHRGGTQDAPLVLNSRINAGEVDEQILDLELGKYPLEMYEMAERGEHSSKVSVENVKKRLKEGREPLAGAAFTHDCGNFNYSVLNSSYKVLPTMKEKVGAQMELCKKIRAVDIDDVSRLIIERHFIRDTKGNLRKFSMQEFRCVHCNTKYRRPPLTGKCMNCGGRIIFTISEGSIMKYMQPALDLARTYHASPYLLESLELTEIYIQSIFGKDKEKQETIGKWF